MTDGDTLTVLTAQRQQHRVRLSGIDAPERRQAFGQVSKQHLSDLAYDKTVSVVFHKRGRYKRILGQVLVNGADAGLDQIETDMAWHYKRYEREQLPEDRVAYARAVEKARAERSADRCAQRVLRRFLRAAQRGPLTRALRERGSRA